MADNNAKTKTINDLKTDNQFEEKVIHVDRVARVVKGGRRFRFRVLVVVGDKKGNVGVGLDKGPDVTSAVAKAVETAKKNMIKVKMYKDTIPHDIQTKVSGAKILLMPASSGTGLIAGGVVRSILEAAGVSNAMSKSLGSSNKINIAYATIEALKALEPSKNWVTNQNKAADRTVAKKKTELPK